MQVAQGAEVVLSHHPLPIEIGGPPSTISGQALIKSGAVKEWQNVFFTFPLDGKVTKDQGLFSTRLTCNQNDAARPRLTRQTLAA